MKVQNKKENFRGWIEASIAYLFILLFVYAAVSKLLDFETFRIQLAQSPLLSAYAGIIAWAVPGVELLISVFLLFSWYRRLALYACFTLMVMFTAYIYIILNFSDFVPCSCGGVLEKLSWGEHLVFNLVFILFAVLAISFNSHFSVKKKFMILGVLTLIGISIVWLLFIFSENKIHRNNAFQRQYMPHPIEKVGEYNLLYNSYYIAGIDSNTIYLGNYKAPLYLTKVHLSSKELDENSIYISNTNLPFQRVRLVVSPPYFYLGDGTVPVLFKGKLVDKYATLFYDQAYFTQYILTNSENIGLVTISSETQNTTLAMVYKANSYDTLVFNNNILSKQIDGVFDSDGSLLWNSKHKRFLYVYRYRNRFEVTDNTLSHLFSRKTIDTISQAIIDLGYYERRHQYKLGANTVIVNKASATYGDYLYIESDRLGRFDDADLTRVSSIIDVYNFEEGSYEFSFHLYHEPNKALKEFRVVGDKLTAIVGETLQIYKLKSAYFNSGSNSTYTMQYQE
ncbi:MAG TPA: MauE/DoxX family redox-associated membrane protein [Aequorivita sp.]|nr:MauE/DoxX family redox-associated membrane protein [Aequorivita sp.]